ncbi:MAG: 23S rRNA (adenine(2503)-C(2))-methyltransferase RlmN, partial [Candidatus Pacebacteria bacterium]|nr:23S rRNA (adenine(2503)-C(2))-methyltransferase RlmN [Candidatus Paceibacterota bacterium]
MNIHKLKKFLEESNQPKFRLEQIKKAVYQDGVSDFSEITNIPKDLREKLREEMNILSFTAQNISGAEDKRSVKALLKLRDGNLIETVLISPKLGDWSVCISSQAGCPLGCAFCATGRGGFKRNLTAEEITDQVLFWKQYLNKNSSVALSCHDYVTSSPEYGRGGKLNNIVFMGMGEP